VIALTKCLRLGSGTTADGNRVAALHPRPPRMASPSRSRSRTPSRAGTPCPQTPSRLVVPPSLRPTHSLSNLHVHMSGLSPGAATTSHHTGEESSASSIINVDMGEGILVTETDAEVGLVDAEPGNVYASASASAGDEASKRALRDHLRRTLNKRDSSAGAGRL
jgi:vacuolar fusion protein MON1